MYELASDEWTKESTELHKQRLARMTDDQLVKELEACLYMTSSRVYWGTSPRESSVIQHQLTRQEIWRRVANRKRAPSGT